ncbi:non-heme iron oxygenase ferredoxin subunit [Janibacter limosus]|jgi:3-phenylpropionate/trans-cinnamate dioxygenase ferredoxin subunit|uniref:Non-heme iron oxygenase ferredoxin subunit n=1 Tax=Janibacter limosus TaxID=53458 RepID=A0A4P6MWT0_9MICO|nr:non-heme iron oxygenase ferredoxin subunit [Janibacter limosus]QBF45873.1 non-heme iron oxygenase ferredoxin subunit [Janibacter limosus]
MSAVAEPDFVRVCHLDELTTGEAAKAEVSGRVIAVVRTEDGTVHAIDDECTHGKVSLSEGEVEGCTIECWLHGSRFDLLSGRPTSLPATVPVRVHTVQVSADGDVLVALAD